ncbi:protein translocase subunit SecD [bacterium]|jgi:preprotein translocase subunit SecD|nr:protein translocase subunit SecD [bacterium]
MTSTRRARLFFLIMVLSGAAYAFFHYPMNMGLDLQGGTRLIIEAQETPEMPIDQDTILGVLGVIRQRVDGLGVSEPIIQRKGLKQIIVELPGVKDPDRAIRLIGETALLEFVEAEWAPPSIGKLSPAKQKLLIGNGRLTVFQDRDAAGEVVSERPIILHHRALTGSDLSSASPGTDQYGRPIVNIEFGDEASKIFFATTKRVVGRPIAIVLDGVIISAPNVNEPIAGGRAQISGGFTVEQMRDLVIKLKAGSLPVPVQIISNKIVGPTLGRDSIEKSKKAAFVGLALVCVYMLFWYRLSGVVSILALGSYLLLIFSLMKLFHATLTLPGIAGIILTIGMAVDANVIIFARIQEEIGVGESLRSAIHAGFAKAFVAILDSNITTLMAATVLFWLGTGSIRGFALTLSLGILVSMFTALFVTKFVLELLAPLAGVTEKTLFNKERVIL